MAYNIDSTAADCYPGTTCLINKLGIQDETILAEKEAAIVFAKASLLDQCPIQGNFDFEHYKQIHHFLFCDLYDWAGQIRTINIGKREQISSLQMKLNVVLELVSPVLPHFLQKDYLTMSWLQKSLIFITLST